MAKAVVCTMKVVLCMFNLCRIGSLYSVHEGMPFLVRPTCAHKKGDTTIVSGRLLGTSRTIDILQSTYVSVRKGSQKADTPKSFPRLNRVSPDSIYPRNTPRQVLLPSLHRILVRERIALVCERTGTSCHSNRSEPIQHQLQLQLQLRNEYC